MAYELISAQSLQLNTIRNAFRLADFHPINPIQDVLATRIYAEQLVMSVSDARLRESVWCRGRGESDQEIKSERKRRTDSSDCRTSEDPLEAYFYQAPLTEVAKSLNLSNSRAQEPPPEFTGVDRRRPVPLELGSYQLCPYENSRDCCANPALMRHKGGQMTSSDT